MNDTARLMPEPMIVEAAERLFERLASRDGAASGALSTFAAQAWREVEASGLACAWVEETLGGAGAAPVDGLAVARAVGRHAVALPVVETLLGGWVLAAAGLELPDGGPLAVVVDESAAANPGATPAHARRVPWARDAGHLVLCTGTGDAARVSLLARDAFSVEPAQSLAGEPLDDVDVDAGAAPLATGTPRAGVDAAIVFRLGALLRAQQMAGALERVLEISLDYARARVQFGRPISRFQAVQQELARLAGECAAASAAAGAGAKAFARYGLAHERGARAAAAAKIRVGEAAGVGAAIAHQVHGAMGFSLEYALQRFTRRLWAWRDDFGGETAWAEWLGHRIAAAGTAALWPALADD